jgi:hypothetical protein
MRAVNKYAVDARFVSQFLAGLADQTRDAHKLVVDEDAQGPAVGYGEESGLECGKRPPSLLGLGAAEGRGARPKSAESYTNSLIKID